MAWSQEWRPRRQRSRPSTELLLTAGNDEVAGGAWDNPGFDSHAGEVITGAYSDVLGIIIVEYNGGSAVITDALGSKEDKGSGSFVPHDVFLRGEELSVREISD